MKKLFVNNGNSPMYVGSQMIPPGEQSMVEVPDEGPAPSVAPPPTLAELVADELKKPVTALIEGLGDASEDALVMMAAVEGQAKKPRSTLLTAIADEQIKRADAKLKTDPV